MRIYVCAHTFIVCVRAATQVIGFGVSGLKKCGALVEWCVSHDHFPADVIV